MADILDSTALSAIMDLYIPNAGSIGYWALLNQNFTTALTFTANAGTDVLTTASNHNLVTGTRVRFATSGAATLPGCSGLTETTLLSSRDYYAIVTGATTLKVADTQALAVAATAINLTDSGSGTLQLTEQSLLVSDLVEVLINHELNATTNPDYARNLWTGAGAAVAGVKPIKSWTQAVGAAETNTLDYRYKLLLKGGISTIGDITGTKSYLITEQALVSVPIGQSVTISVTVSQTNQATA
jgi:hypothetical protein